MTLQYRALLHLCIPTLRTTCWELLNTVIVSEMETWPTMDFGLLLIRKQILVGVNGRCLLFQGWFIGLRWAYKPCACNRLSKIGGRGEEICQILSFLTVFAKGRIIAIFLLVFEGKPLKRRNKSGRTNAAANLGFFSITHSNLSTTGWYFGFPMKVFQYWVYSP